MIYSTEGSGLYKKNKQTKKQLSLLPRRGGGGEIFFWLEKQSHSETYFVEGFSWFQHWGIFQHFNTVSLETALILLPCYVEYSWPKHSTIV